MRTLVVEDEFVARRILQRFLSRYGLSDVAVDGQEALDAVRTALEEKEPYDLICLDVWLPKIDGQQVLEEVRALERKHGIQVGRGSWVIMTTSARAKEYVMGAFRGGADAYLTKPIEVDALTKELTALGLLK
jgi:two-component system, chemotaxis family, chemotaxis protein CheY